ncbi:TetR/AcrR family transcriptional regulator [Nocardia stercoris]|uniref:TetR/AcrR family transcriptional regulator n=1 Tax=Nocardia stercoris TaxID=2483361 RepID=A0A3M2L0R8_9NOCA|nr:TetR/AcrR family transcriptional regulator [Nocardia stercoris]RMI30546.1 TetR/AcrR family transcriptional regulator [Nocardia stercoris]
MTRGGGTRRRYSGMSADERTSARRTAILAAALELFGTAGFAATSVKQICAAAGLTERYFYESFRDRHAALVGLYTALVTDLRAATDAAIATAGDDPVAAAGAGLRAFITYLTDDPRRARVVLIEVVGVSPDIEELRHGVLRAFADLIAAVWTAQPGVNPHDEQPQLMAVALSGGVNNLLVDWMMTGMRQSPQVLTEACTTLFVAALDALRNDN